MCEHGSKVPHATPPSPLGIFAGSHHVPRLCPPPLFPVIPPFSPYNSPTRGRRRRSHGTDCSCCVMSLYDRVVVAGCHPTSAPMWAAVPDWRRELSCSILDILARRDGWMVGQPGCVVLANNYRLGNEVLQLNGRECLPRLPPQHCSVPVCRCGTLTLRLSDGNQGFLRSGR